MSNESTIGDPVSINNKRTDCYGAAPVTNPLGGPVDILNEQLSRFDPFSAKPISTRAFLTGSHAYGTPRADSDIDLCVLLSREDYDKLKAVLPEDAREDMDDGRYDAEPGGMNIRFGNLNLLAFNDCDIFRAWEESTETCKQEAPCERSRAREIIKGRVELEWDRIRDEASDEGRAKRRDRHSLLI